MKKILLILLVAMITVSCGEKMTLEKISQMESQVFGENKMMDKESANQLLDAYMLFAEQNPQDENAPEMTFKALDISVNLNTDNPEKTIEIADAMIENYPDFELTPMAMFIKGFVYENQLSDLKKARETYNMFIDKYPDNPMVEDVKSTINNLGIPIEELIRNFESAAENQ